MIDLKQLFSEHKTRNRVFAFLSWLTAFVVYSLTVAPTTSFWDAAEYIAISHTLQVAHPPGAPFFALVGRVVSMFIPTEYVALSINMISVTASAFTIMLLYLIVVRLVEEFKGPVDSMSEIDRIGTYSGALIGALTFIFTPTHWFNAVEAEMYASSMFLTALVVWMALCWSANHEDEHSERWLVMIALLFGIGIGVHLLNLLTLFFVALIVYFKLRSFSVVSFLVMGVIAVASFLLVFPFTIITLPNFVDNFSGFTYGVLGPFSYIVIIVGLIVGGIWYTQKRGMRLLNLALLCYAMILIGYSSYAMVIIRSQASPPIDENDPSDLTSFVSYLSRDQYGSTPILSGYSYNNQLQDIDRSKEKLFPRRHSQQPRHMEYYANFSSDLDFFLSYQVNHMYLRYFNWNFIGRASDVQDAGWFSGFGENRNAGNPANSGYFYLPFLLGLLGLLYHFRADWKRALSILALFFLTGLAIIFYLNQTPFEPRERDYAYVGSFFAFAIWVGMGGTAMIELVKQKLAGNRTVGYGATALMILAVPVWMGIQNYPSHDRSERYVARDYAYNLLNSLEENALIFTNGDNDTFPLWYIQEVEGVRTDVRVVCLSLLNTDWYIKQMRDRQTHESLPLPITFTDEEIAEFTSKLELYDPQVKRIPVDKEFLSRVFSEGINGFEGVNLSPVMENQIRMATPFSMPVEELDDVVEWRVEGRFAGQDGQGNRMFYLQAQDMVVLELLEQNRWVRPVYFANTVSREAQLGLQDYFQFEGKAFRVVPKKRNSGAFGYVDPEVHGARLESFAFTNWDHESAYFDENIRRMLSNYRYGFTQQADVYLRQGDLEKAEYWLEFGEEKVPFRSYENDWTIPTLYVYRYQRAESFENAGKLALFVAQPLKEQTSWLFQDLLDVETEISELREKIDRARADASFERARSLAAAANRLNSESDSLIQEINTRIFKLVILQNALFESGNTEAAEELTREVTAMTGDRFPFPTDAEASAREVGRYNLGI